MKKRYPHKNNILLVNITRLGDMLQATPTIAGMKLENPNAKITVLVEQQFSEVCRYIPNVDEVVAIDLSLVVRALAREQDGIVDAFEYVTEVVEDLRKRKFDYCLNMSSSAYTALLLNLVGITRNGGWTADPEGFRKIESDWARLFATSVFHQNRQFNSLNLVDVFRCSADVDAHPQKLLITVEQEAQRYAEELIREARFTNTGPLVAVQAGASQEKRQWAPELFAKFISLLVYQHNCRIIMTGSNKELSIIDPIVAQVNSPNVCVAAGKTSIPQLAALLKESDLLVTGDTGPMHIAVATGTPVVAMFLASAYGFETGPYSEGNIILQPVIGCGPCNPNKPCARPDCHTQIPPELVAELVLLRLRGEVRSLPSSLINSSELSVYRSCFDEFGFCDLEPLDAGYRDPWRKYRNGYRRLWLDELGGFQVPQKQPPILRTLDDQFLAGLSEIEQCAEKGTRLINELSRLIQDIKAPPHLLGQLSDDLSELDRKIEEIGFHVAPLGPVTRMFLFAKENLSGTDALSLASEMGGVYEDLKRRSLKLGSYVGE